MITSEGRATGQEDPVHLIRYTRNTSSLRFPAPLMYEPHVSSNEQTHRSRLPSSGDDCTDCVEVCASRTEPVDTTSRWAGTWLGHTMYPPAA